MATDAKEKRFCGNCSNHNPYEYPKRMFCLKRYAQNKEPAVDTLWCCGDWNPVIQACHCVRDALKEKTVNNAALRLLHRIRVLMA